MTSSPLEFVQKVDLTLIWFQRCSKHYEHSAWSAPHKLTNYGLSSDSQLPDKQTVLWTYFSCTLVAFVELSSVSEGSLLEPLLFSTFINDLCHVIKQFAGHGSRSVWDMNCLRSLGSRDRGFESHSKHGYLVCVCVCSVFVLSCVWSEAFRRTDHSSKESYRLWKWSWNWKNQRSGPKGAIEAVKK
jgi:hypothetical protein